MKKYTYSGAMATTINLSDDEQIVMWPGKSYDLPEDHPHVVGLLAQGLLAETIVEVEVKSQELKADSANPKTDKKKTDA